MRWRADLVGVRAGGSRRPATHATVVAREHDLRLQGREVLRFAVGKLTELVQRIVTRNGLGLDDVAPLGLHHAHRRILHAAVRTLGIGHRWWVTSRPMPAGPPGPTGPAGFLHT